MGEKNEKKKEHPESDSKSSLRENFFKKRLL